jgi:diacylglycerol kinase (ATP)
VLLSVLYAVAAFMRGISATEWIISVVVVVVIWILEILNTAIEKICDFVYSDHHEEIGVIKDLAASAVLMMVILAFVLSVLFLIWPHLI